MKANGTVTKATNRDGRFGIEIGEGNWYNGFGLNPCKAGDVIEFEYVENVGKIPGTVFKNVKPEDVKILESSPDAEVPISATQLSIEKTAKLRRVTDCILKSADLVSAGTITQEDLIPKAQAMYKAIGIIADADN